MDCWKCCVGCKDADDFHEEFQAWIKIRLHLKDLTNALTTAQALGIPLPLSSLIQQILVSLIAEVGERTIIQPWPPFLKD